MRVLVVTNMWPSAERPASGAFVRDQVEALRGLDGLDVEVFAFPHGGGWRSYAHAARTLRRRYAQRRFDVVHSHYGLTGWSALAVPGSHVRVVTYHGTDLHDSTAGPLSRGLSRFVDAPAVVSSGLARAPGVGLAGAGRTRFTAVLPCGVNLERFRPLDRAEARRKLSLDASRPYLLFPANPARPEKRSDRARSLAAALPDTELITLGTTRPEEVPLLVNAVNAVLVTSDRESFGLAALEALACDVPVLSTDVGVAATALAGVEGTLCAPFDEHRWLAALRPSLEGAGRVSGRARAAVFGRDRMAERVLELYRDLVGQASSRSQ